MRKMAWLLAVAACSPAHTDVTTDAPQRMDDAPLPDGGNVPDLKGVTGVVVGAHQVAWSRGSEGCPIAEGGGPCPIVSPSLMTAPLATGTATTRLSSLMGFNGLAGDDDALFMFDEESPKTFLVRVRPGFPEEILYTFQTYAVAPVVDATNVYWISYDTAYRASRTGDGSDVTILASSISASTAPVVFAGYLWWSNCGADCQLFRVPVAGGAVQTVAGGGYLLGASATALYTGSDDRSQITAHAANGTTTVVVDQLAQADFPVYFVAAGSDLYWNNAIQLIHATAGSPPTAITGITLASTAFGVTADSILYNFTTTGYQTVPR